MLYGAVNVPQRKEPQKYFEDIQKQLKEAQILKEADKAQEEAAKAGMGAVPLVSSAKMFDSHAKAWKKAAEQLRSEKDKYMETAEGREKYTQLLNELNFGIQESEAYFKEASPELEANLNIARSGQNLDQWEKQGQKDSHDLAYYEGVLNDLDSDKFAVSIQDGHFVLDDGKGPKSIEDPSLMDFSIVKPALVMTDPVDPKDWWVRSHDDRMYEDREEAKQWTRATVGQSQRGNLDVARWWVSSGKAPEGMTAEEVVNEAGRMDEALNAYAEDAVPEGWSKEDPNENAEPTAEEKKKTRFNKSLDEIITNVSNPNASALPPMAPGPPTPDQATYEFPSQDYVTIDTSAWGDEAMKDSDGKIISISITGIKHDALSSDIEIMTNVGPIQVTPGTPVYKSIKLNIDRAEGEGAFERIFDSLYAATH
jgi:hypothetical protein